MCVCVFSQIDGQTGVNTKKGLCVCVCSQTDGPIGVTKGKTKLFLKDITLKSILGSIGYLYLHSLV